MMTTIEAIGLGLCLTGAVAVVSYLIYLKATSEGHAVSVIGRGLVIIWLCVGAAVAVLIGARAALGGALFDVSLGQGKVWWQPGGARQICIVAAAVAILAGLALVALRTARDLQEPAHANHNGQDPATRGGLP